jgi:NTE family protein
MIQRVGFMRLIRQGIFIFILFITGTLHAQQKVGIVFSGGGAKGIAHIGVLKALEENEIPIDYMVGTSMGGIIGGCYAAGMSPSQIEEMILSSEFLDWVNGRFEKELTYYYFKDEENPSFMRLNLSLDSTFQVMFNSSLANDISLNFALAEKLAQPSAIAKNNFDSLFIPLRVMASDIFTQKEVVLSNGLLSDALRATQTVPLFYKPIRIDGKYLFDGGIYNNFPVDVAMETFKPDVIIGCNVSSKVFEEYPYNEDDKLLSKSLLFMILDKSDPSKIPASGIYIQPDLKPFTSFDFAKAKALIDSGYVQTLRQMPEIKQKIAARRNCEEVAQARNKFNNRTPPLLVERVTSEGFSKNQQRYLNKFFKSSSPLLPFGEVKSDFYKLVSEDYFSNIYPSFNFDPESEHFSFNLVKRPHNNFKVDFGGVIASRNISNIFLGLNYYRFNNTLTHAEANFAAGNFYKSAQVKARIDLPNRGKFYLEPEALFNSWDYLETSDWLITNTPPTAVARIDRKIGLNLGIPLGNKYRMVIDNSYINNRDQYNNSNVLISADTLDVLKLTGSRLGLSFLSNSLNRKQYASSGQRLEASVHWFWLNETIEPGTTSVRSLPEEDFLSFIRARLIWEQYVNLKGVFRIGYFFDGSVSNQPALSNYQATMLNAPAFTPIQDSRTLILEKFRAYNYVAGGLRNIFLIRKGLEARLEGYFFKPLQSISAGPNQETIFSTNINEVYFAASANMVLHTTVGPVSLCVNYYDDKENQLGVLLHVGFLLFKKTSLE